MTSPSTSTFVVDDMARARRFIILGCEGGTFSTQERPLAIENAAAIGRILASKEEGVALVDLIIQISKSGAAAKQGPALFAFAMCAKLGDVETRRAAYASLAKVCRIPTHLFSFVGMVESMSETTGWGRAQRRAISAFYNNKPPAVLAQHVTKYKNREGWTHRDVLRLAHVKPVSQATATVLHYAVKGAEGGNAELLAQKASDDEEALAALAYLSAVEMIKELGACIPSPAPVPAPGGTGVDAETETTSAASVSAASVAAAVMLIKDHGLVREHVPSNLLNAIPVWEALLEKMPATALLRNLGKLSKLGLLAEGSPRAATVAARLSNPDILQRAKVHPFSILLAKATYDTGHGLKGSLEWPVNPAISAALDSGFSAAFGAVKPSGKRILQAVDVSGSMAWSPVMGSDVISARVGAAALAYIAQNIEPNCSTVGFGGSVKLLPEVTAAPTLAAATEAISQLPDGPLDLVLMLDCTGSMGAFIEESKKKLIAITEQLGAWYVGQKDGLRVGFVGYRDIGDAGQHVVCDPTSDFESVLEVVKAQGASGGGDYPEDICGAFQKVLELPFRQDATKLVVHICDAPCHGIRYNREGGGSGDNYPDGDPEGRNPEKQLERFAQKGIDYVLFDVCHASDELKVMTDLFKAAYNEAPGKTTELEMGVSHLHADAGRLEQTILDSVERSAYGAGTDVAAPIVWAGSQSPPVEVDVFVIYTDSETSPRCGGISAADALRAYRAKTGIQAKLAVVAMTASDVSVADPNDTGMLDMVGFDASGPAVLTAFIDGRL